jgi:hypothetical protein
MNDSGMTNSGAPVRQAERFLSILEAMTPEAQRVFRRIYALAPKAGQHRISMLTGHHVRVAMIESLAHPQIAYWVRMNLAMRVARKFCQTTGRQDKVARLNTLLEEFHIAADAFVLKLSLDMATEHRMRLKNAGERKGIAILPEVIAVSGIGISEQDFDHIQAFKRTIIPGFIGSIRRKLTA